MSARDAAILRLRDALALNLPAARALGVSDGLVLARMEGLVDLGADGYCRLTDAGAREADRLWQRYCTARGISQQDAENL